MKKRIIIMICLLAILLGTYIYSFIPKFVALHKGYVIKKFTKIYCDSKVQSKTKWFGIHIIQNPCDMWAIQELIYEIKPDFIIETGTLWGGSALFFAYILRDVNKNGKVITVDIVDRTEEVSNLQFFRDKVEFILGDSVSKEVIDKVEERIKGASKVIVTLDLDHSKEHVFKELKLYSRFVSVGSYIVVQDTHLDGWRISKKFKIGPMAAVNEFLKTNKNFYSDRYWEKFLLTWYPCGYLKRIR